MPDHPAITERDIERLEGDARHRDRDRLVVEAPLELRAGGEPLVVVMRTPGDDLELSRGLLCAEGVIRERGEADAIRLADPDSLRAAEVGNVVDVGMDPELVRERWPTRALYASSSCGVCGKTAISDLETRAEPVKSELRVPRAVITALPERLREAQDVFSETGGLHAAGAFDAGGQARAVREDVGRHNAVDKLVGWALVEDLLPASSAVLCVSGRLSFEIVQKAVVAGFPIVVAVSAPSSMAVDLAERFRVTLCGFVRGGRLNIYTHSTRVS